jgi:hypothetical protein
MKSFRYVRENSNIRSEIRYFDDNMNPVPRDKAKRAFVRNVDENGNLLFEAESFIE